MNRAFWQAIKENDYAVPTGYTLTSLTQELLAALGSTDPAVRGEPNHTVLEEWMHRSLYSAEELRQIAHQMLKNITIGLGKEHDDTVFLRTFSLLILNEIIDEDNQRPFLTESEIHDWLEQVLTYFATECDVRGYVPGKGWAHSVAHTADTLLVLARNRFLQTSELERLLTACTNKLVTATTAFLYEEDERLAYAALTALRRNLLSSSFLHTWLRQLARPDNQSWSIETFYTPEQTGSYHNLKLFLRSLYFQLKLTMHSPQYASELLLWLEEAIHSMDRGYFILP